MFCATMPGVGAAHWLSACSLGGRLEGCVSRARTKWISCVASCAGTGSDQSIKAKGFTRAQSTKEHQADEDAAKQRWWAGDLPKSAVRAAVSEAGSGGCVVHLYVHCDVGFVASVFVDACAHAVRSCGTAHAIPRRWCSW